MRSPFCDRLSSRRDPQFLRPRDRWTAIWLIAAGATVGEPVNGAGRGCSILFKPPGHVRYPGVEDGAPRINIVVSDPGFKLFECCQKCLAKALKLLGSQAALTMTSGMTQ